MKSSTRRWRSVAAVMPPDRPVSGRKRCLQLKNRAGAAGAKAGTGEFADPCRISLLAGVVGHGSEHVEWHVRCGSWL